LWLTLTTNFHLTWWRNDTQYNDTKHNDTRHNELNCESDEHFKVCSDFAVCVMLCVVMLSVLIPYAELHYSRCRYAGCHYGEGYYTEWEQRHSS
jgi:hypothetical protein